MSGGATRRRRASASWRTRAARFAVPLALVPALLSGCATTTGGVPGAVSRSIASVASSAESVALVYAQNLAGRTTDAVTATTLDDMLDEVATEQTAVAELDASDSADVRMRDDATTLIRRTVDAIDQARTALALDEGTPAATFARQRARYALEQAAAEASALSDRLEPYR